jgi:hypothetical protein
MNTHTHHSTGAALKKIVVAATLAACSGLAGAEDCTSTLLFPWDAHGKVYEVAPKTLMFVGEIKGTLYAETGKGVLDAASMRCPMLYEIDVTNGNTRGEGRCAIHPKGSSDMVYATYSCQGEIGSCAGQLYLSGGTGRFEGISGSGGLVSRTGASELAVRLGPGGAISNAEGLMTLREFSYSTP